MTIQLPIITRIVVSDYELYPGSNQQGIEWPVLKGVSVVAGVNGLGKTTFLNILFRLLAGPFDWRADESGDIGNLSHSLQPMSDTSFFRARVRDGAAEATACADLQFGARQVSVTRTLKDLRITALRTDGSPAEPTEEAYRAAVLDASGLATDFDFHLVLRLLVFYLEDRRPLVWDRTAQDEVLRALFYPTEQAREASRLADAVQRLDSEFRNQRVFLNRQAKALEQAEALAAADEASRARYNTVNVRLRALQEREDQFDREVDQADRERTLARQRVERAELRHEEVKREHQDMRQRFFASLYPTIAETGNYILVNLDSGAGCLVCGNVAEDAANRLHHCVERGVCPLCDAPPERQDVRPARQSRTAVQRLAELEERRNAARGDLRAFEVSRDAAHERYIELFTARAAVVDERDRLERELEVLRQLLPPPDEEIEALRRFVADLRRKQNALKLRQQAEEVHLREAIRIGRKEVERVAQRVARRFRENAAAFLAEICEIVVVEEQRKFGTETGQFPMPRFTVKLTSGVFHDQPQPRRDDHEVSESQKEFIDLAFRLALIQEVSQNRPSMVVIETPEASLDSIFIFRAGHLLADYAAGGGEVGNRLIASSNLNKEDMIPALFGLASEEEYEAWWRTHKTGAPERSAGAVPVEQRAARVLNLLNVAAENRAVEENRGGYELRFDRAINPPWSRPPARRRR